MKNLIFLISMFSTVAFGQVAQKIGNRANQDVSLCKNLGGGSESCITHDNTGKTGFGTASPISRVDSVHDVSAEYAGRFRNTNATGNGMSIQAGDGASAAVIPLAVTDSGTSVEYLVIKGDGTTYFNGGGNLGLNTTTPDPNAHLHVFGGDSTANPSFSTINTVMTVEDSGNTGIQFLGGTGNLAIMYFGDSADQAKGEINYHLGNDEYKIYSNGVLAMNINSAQETQLEVPADGDCNSSVPTGNVCSGTFLPTTTNDVNLVSSGTVTHGFTRLGNTWMIGIQVNVDINSGQILGTTDLSLPTGLSGNAVNCTGSLNNGDDNAGISDVMCSITFQSVTHLRVKCKNISATANAKNLEMRGMAICYQ